MVKAHGGGAPRGFADAVMIAYDLAGSDYDVQIARNMQRLGPALEQLKETVEAQA